MDQNEKEKIARGHGVMSDIGISAQHANYLEAIKPMRDQFKQYDDLFKPMRDQFKQYDDLFKPMRDQFKQYDDFFKPMRDQFKQYDDFYKPINGNKLFEDIKKYSYPKDLLFSTELFNEVSVSKVLIEAAQELKKSSSENSEEDFSVAINDLIEGLPEILRSESANSLNEYLDKVPEKSRWMLYVFFCCCFWAYLKALFVDTAVGLTSDNLKPMIRAYVCEKDWATNKIISALICGTPEGRFKSNRFVKVDHLYVRKTPNAKGEVIDLLPRFEPVTLIEKSENLSWSLIRYKNDDGELMEGWVFSRYLYKPDHLG